VAKLRRQAESDAPAIASVVVRDDESLVFADALLSEIVRTEDGVIAMRKRATGPMYVAIREVESWFRPLVTILDAGKRHLKSEIQKYRVAQADAEDEARRIAAQAARTRDAGTLVEALTVAAEVSAPVAGVRSSSTFRWEIEAIDTDALPAEYWTPDVERIRLEASTYPGKGPAPVIPGVTFKRVATIGAKR
jgi:hypothetical protein